MKGKANVEPNVGSQKHFASPLYKNLIHEPCKMIDKLAAVSIKCSFN